MESTSDLDWADRRGRILAADDGPVNEAYRMRTYSRRACPECFAQTLVRFALPSHLRLLRKVGIDLRHYACDTCGHDTILRHREP